MYAPTARTLAVGAFGGHFHPYGLRGQTISLPNYSKLFNLLCHTLSPEVLVTFSLRPPLGVQHF